MPVRDGRAAWARVAVLTAVLGLLLAWAWWISRGRAGIAAWDGAVGLEQGLGTAGWGPRATYASRDVNGLGGLSLTLPAGWRAESLSTDAWRGGVLVRAREGGVWGRGRELTVEVYPQVAVLPPAAFLVRRLGVTVGFERVEEAGTVWAVAGVRYTSGRGPRSGGEGASVESGGGRGAERFEWVAVTVVPSGRALVVRLGGPGGGELADAVLVRGVLRRIDVAEWASAASATLDAAAVSLRPLAMPTSVLAEWGLASARQGGGERAGDGLGSRLKQVVVLGGRGRGTPSEGVVTVEVFPVVVPGWPQSLDTADGTEHPTVRALRTMAGGHDARLLEGHVQRLTATRLLVTPKSAHSTAGDGGGGEEVGLLAGEFPVAAMLVGSEGAGLGPLAALLVARGEGDAAGGAAGGAPGGAGGGGTGLLRALSRVAERVTFVPHAEELSSLLEAGGRLAAQLRAGSAGPAGEADGGTMRWVLEAAGAGAGTPPVGTMELNISGTLEVVRETPWPHRLLRTERLREGGGEGGSVRTVAVAWQVRGLAEVGGAEPSPAATAPSPAGGEPSSHGSGRASAAVEEWTDVLVRTFDVMAPRAGGAADGPAGELDKEPSGEPAGKADGEPGQEPDGELMAVRRYAPGPALLAGVMRAETAALVVTDTVGWLDLDREGLFSLVLVQPLAADGAGRRWAVHAVGTGRTLVVRDGPTGPGGTRGPGMTVEEPGRLRGRH
ncbi:MAG: hypothetical protein ACK4PI_14045 [Tepidisphaerales bacterium]